MPNAPFLIGEDIAYVERRADVRIMLSLPGRYTLANRRDPKGARREYACRVINLSCRSMALAVPVAGDVGERVMAHIDQFGKFEGPITRVLDGGFVMDIICPDSDRHKLASRIIWFDKLKNHDAHDSRRHPRVIPRNPYSVLVFADGTTAQCLIIDLSAGGAAVSADITPPVGSVLAVGKLVGRVVRHFSEGFAVEFTAVQDPAAVEDLVTRG